MIGRTVSHYEILARLGSGGMGDVYRARDRRLDRTVVLKFLPPARAEDAAARERFLREAQAASRLDHSSICTIYDIDELDDGTQFICMAHCDGESLADRLAAGPLPPGEAARIALRVAEGLVCAHDNGVVHRDLKPSNIQLTGRGEVKILDFGVARLAGQERLTMTGTAVGTLPYMAPEQIRSAEVDHRCDLWALGVLLYEMLTGQRPFRAEDPVALMRVIVDQPTPDLTRLAPGTPPDLVNLVRWCLEKDPDERPQRAADLVQPLLMQARLSDDATVTLTPGGASWRPPRRRRTAAIVLALVALVLLTVTFLWPAGEVRHGVALLPWSVVGGELDDRLLGDGLVLQVNHELMLIEPSQPAGWIAPASDVKGWGITSTERARGRLGVGRVVSGTLHVHGEVLRLELLLHDTGVRPGEELDDPPRQRTVVGSSNDLVTWTEEVFRTVVAMLDWRLPRGVRSAVSTTTHNHAALAAYLQGLGAAGPVGDGPTDQAAAAAAFDRAVSLDPRFAAPLAWLGRLARRGALSSEGPDRRLALAYVDSALARSPGLLDAHYLRGRILLHERDPAARDCFQRCLALVPGHWPSTAMLGEAYLQAGAVDSAEAVLRRGMALRPDDPSAHYRLGAMLFNESRYDEASRSFRRVVELAPDRVDAYISLGSVAFQQEDWEAAAAMFQRALAVEPDAVTYENLGTVYFYQRRLTDAGRMYELAAELSPRKPYAYGWAAECFWWSGVGLQRARALYGKAATLADSALADDPHDHELAVNLASYLIRLGDTERAAKILDEVEASEARDLNVQYMLATCFEDLGQRDRALEHLERALRGGFPRRSLEFNPALDNLRQSPEYARLLARIDGPDER